MCATISAIEWAVRLRVHVISGEAVKDRARPEMHAFTTEHADQQIGVVDPIESPESRVRSIIIADIFLDSFNIRVVVLSEYRLL